MSFQSFCFWKDHQGWHNNKMGASSSYISQIVLQRLLLHPQTLWPNKTHTKLCLLIFTQPRVWDPDRNLWKIPIFDPNICPIRASYFPGLFCVKMHTDAEPKGLRWLFFFFLNCNKNLLTLWLNLHHKNVQGILLGREAITFILTWILFCRSRRKQNLARQSSLKWVFH